MNYKKLFIPLFSLSTIQPAPINSFNADSHAVLINNFMSNPGNKDLSMDFILHLRLTQKIAVRGKKDTDYFKNLTTKNAATPSCLTQKNYYKILQIPYNSTSEAIQEFCKAPENSDFFKQQSHNEKYENLILEGEKAEGIAEKIIGLKILSNQKFREIYDNNQKETLISQIISEYLDDLFTNQAKFLKLLWSHKLSIHGIVKGLPQINASQPSFVLQFLNQHDFDEKFFHKNITSLDALNNICNELESFSSAIINLLNPAVKQAFNSWYKEQQNIK